jgi:spoIIIJ-associated protein
MKSVELTGRTIEEIRAQAAEELGVPAERLEVEVLEEKRGLLGFLGGGLRARVTVKGEAEEAPATEAVAPEGVAAPEEAEERAGIIPEDELARLANRAEETANEILRLMGLSVTARAAEIGDDQVTIDLSGDDIALVIGKHGDTLDALQLLTAIIANRDAPNHARVVVDAEGYRDRRRRALEASALTYAAKAIQTGREVVVRDLKAYERRVVHMALRNDERVETYSEGEGRHRTLVISPVPAGGARTRRAFPEDEEPGDEG